MNSFAPCTAPAPRFRLAPIHDVARGHWINGIERGDGDPLLLIMGLGGNVDMWDALIEQSTRIAASSPSTRPAPGCHPCRSIAVTDSRTGRPRRRSPGSPPDQLGRRAGLLLRRSRRPANGGPAPRSGCVNSFSPPPPAVSAPNLRPTPRRPAPWPRHGGTTPPTTSSAPPPTSMAGGRPQHRHSGTAVPIPVDPPPAPLRVLPATRRRRRLVQPGVPARHRANPHWFWSATRTRWCRSTPPGRSPKESRTPRSVILGGSGHLLLLDEPERSGRRDRCLSDSFARVARAEAPSRCGPIPLHSTWRSRCPRTSTNMGSR